MPSHNKKSNTEQQMIDILQSTEESLSLDEIVNQILQLSPSTLKGKTPKKSLYSVIFRREKKRKERSEPSLFITKKRGGATYYSLNPNNIKTANEKVLKK